MWFQKLQIKPNYTTIKGCCGCWCDQTFVLFRGNISYPPPFGREATPEEAKIVELDGKTGASLKLTILNEKGRIWTMVAGGGASVIYADTIVDMGGVNELANYGEYSGAPNEIQTYEYAKTVIDLMCRHPHPGRAASSLFFLSLSFYQPRSDGSRIWATSFFFIFFLFVFFLNFEHFKV